MKLLKLYQQFLSNVQLRPGRPLMVKGYVVVRVERNNTFIVELSIDPKLWGHGWILIRQDSNFVI